MVIVTESNTLHSVEHSGIRKLLALRLAQLSSSDEADRSHTQFILLEIGDSASTIEQAAGFSILTSLFDGLPFDHPDFYPLFEIMEEHQDEQYRFYEMVFISNDDGAATAIFVPDEEGIDANLLAMCRSWATPSVRTP